MILNRFSKIATTKSTMSHFAIYCLLQMLAILYLEPTALAPYGFSDRISLVSCDKLIPGILILFIFTSLPGTKWKRNSKGE